MANSQFSRVDVTGLIRKILGFTMPCKIMFAFNVNECSVKLKFFHMYMQQLFHINRYSSFVDIY